MLSVTREHLRGLPGGAHEDRERHALALPPGHDADLKRISFLPANEPGSSIMPGKVNTTQCEAILMIGIQVMGSDTAVALAASQGNFELNAMRPVIIYNFLHSTRILADGCEKFRVYSVEGTQLNENRLREYVDNSLMMVTALASLIGYDKAAQIAHRALSERTTLKAAALASGFIDENTFDSLIEPLKVAGQI